MSLEFSVNFYDTRHLNWRNCLIGFFSRTNITHVGLQVDLGTQSIEYTCIDKNRGLSVVNPKVYSKLYCKPVDSIKLGIVDKPLPEIPDNFSLTGRGLLFYHLIGRFIGSDMPDGCCVFVSQVLVDLGIIKRKIFYPEQLYKELNKCR